MAAASNDDIIVDSRIENFDNLLQEMLDNGDTNQDIILALHAHGVKISLAGLKRRLQELGLKRSGRATEPITDALADRVKHHFFYSRLNEEWYRQTLQQFGISNSPVANDFLQQGRGIVPDWYKRFVYEARRHNAAGERPFLMPVAPPEDSKGALAAVRERLEVLQQLGYESSDS
jgi:hypothetical protein